MLLNSEPHQYLSIGAKDPVEIDGCVATEVDQLCACVGRTVKSKNCIYREISLESTSKMQSNGIGIKRKAHLPFTTFSIDCTCARGCDT